MNYSIIRYILCRVLEFEGLFLSLPCLVALIYGEKDGYAFLATMLFCLLIGFVGKQFKPKSNVFYAKEGFVTVSLSWILLSLMGAVPFYISGTIPRYVDALFETVSGLTTTGGSILTDVEALSHCMQFWRLFTHWIGGMGVLVLILAILPLSGSYNMHLMRAESPGPSVGKLVPRVKNTAMILYGIYLVITVVEVIALLCTGLPLFDSVTLTFSTVGTGGFGIVGDSIASYSMATRTVITIFMILCGINFNVYYLFLIRKPKEALKSEEVRVYLLLILVSTLLITWNIHGSFANVFQDFHHALLQVASIITTTGFASVDYNASWPEFSKTILFLLTLLGACAGSTGGGFKVSRLVVLVKSIRNEIQSVVHPRSVKKVHMDGKLLPDGVARSIRAYLIIYVTIYLASFLLISLDNFDFTTNFTAIAANLNNVGPGLNMVGPAGNYSQFSVFSKLVLIFDMITGRLEFLPMLVLLTPKTWKR